MEPEPLHRLIKTLNALAGSAAGLSDAQLLERFVAGHDEAAFELLLWRHGSMVLGVCRRTLGNPHDAEDAFQATFMILARKAASVARGETVGAWLAKVAYRVALRARAELAKQAQREQIATEQLAAPVSAPEQDEFRRVLDEEIDRLPARQRAVVVLCCLEGKTGEQAARELGCAPGTVSSRLTRARERLRRRLARRGLAPAEPLPEISRHDAPPAPLVGRALDAALAFASPGATRALPARSLAYAEGVLRAMFVNKLKAVALLVLLVGALIAGGFATGHALDASAPPQENQARADRGEKAKQKEQPAPAAVRVIKPQAGGLGLTARVRCTVQAFEQEQMYPAVSGTLKSLDVDVGDVVKKGQLLGVIDAPLLSIAEKEAAVSVRLSKGQVQQKQAKIATLKAEAEAAKSVILQRKAEVDGAKATLGFEEKQLARLATLLKNNTVDRKLVDEKEQVVQAAKARLAAATAVVENAKAELDVKQGKLAQGEAALVIARVKVELADLALEKAHHSASLARLVAAFDGVVTERNVAAGQRVQAGENSGRLSMLTIQRTDKVRMVTHVAQNEAALIQAGIGADVAIDAYPKDHLKDRTVSRVGFVLNPQTGTMRVEIGVANPKNQFRPGMTGTVTLRLRQATAGAVRLPVASLARRSGKGGPVVYVVRDGKARRTPVKLGNRSDEEVEITSGLKATDVVVADPKGFTEEVVPVEVKKKDG